MVPYRFDKVFLLSTFLIMPSRDCSLQKACGWWSVAVLEARAGPMGEGWGNAGKQDLERMDPSLNSGNHRLQSSPSSEIRGTPITPATEARARVRSQKH